MTQVLVKKNNNMKQNIRELSKKIWENNPQTNVIPIPDDFSKTDLSDFIVYNIITYSDVYTKGFLVSLAQHMAKLDMRDWKGIFLDLSQGNVEPISFFISFFHKHVKIDFLDMFSKLDIVQDKKEEILAHIKSRPNLMKIFPKEERFIYRNTNDKNNLDKLRYKLVEEGFNESKPEYQKPLSLDGWKLDENTGHYIPPSE